MATRGRRKGDVLRFQDLLVPWEALKMTLAIIPGMCLVVWAGSMGWSGKRVSLRDLSAIWREMNRAKHEGLKETARTFVPVFPLLGYLLLLVILFLIPVDTFLLMVVNLCAMPAAIVSYREGRRVGAFSRGPADWHQFDLPWPSLLRILVLWLVVCIAVLIALCVFGIWHPS